ncbi:hypothetical protein FRX31_020064 [Thalictrum thalictroides]|uniref:F-box/LRR-repeat protein 15/At3g58940/PEG3-like LRR domain-containing protein n=1 Tax=Thalictrum thalictroides TaxID=46969 RepID=A0A7J6W200_THATH|nr:hypothetical protein FRX31_020064 [Thalictrum thalictroides]
MTEFSLSSTDLSLPASVSLLSIRILKLLNVNNKDGQLEVLISAIPSLETLLLERCAFKNYNLTISSTQLKNFYIYGGIPSSVVISTPNLISLKFNINNKKPATMTFDCDLLSLSNAMIGNVDICSQSWIQLLSAIKNARSLILSENFFQQLVQEVRKDDPLLNFIQIPFYNLKGLELVK